MQTEKITELMEKNKVKLAVLLCHHNADPDAVCSAYAFSQLLKRLKPNLDIDLASAQGPSRLSKSLLAILPVKLTSQPRINEADMIVMLDTNTIQQLDEWGELVKASTSPLVVIDHHASHPETESLATLCIADEHASSTSEIVYRLFKESGIKPTKEEARALFLGMAFDTKHFILASSGTFKAVAELVDVGVNAEEALNLLSLPMDSSECIARLKACQRVKLKKANNWIIALSHVSTYQASAARALIMLGADVAVVAGQREDAVQVSLRSSQKFHAKTGVHLGRDLANPLGAYLHGMGGGHSTSAGANGTGDVEPCLKYCFRLLKAKLK